MHGSRCCFQVFQCKSGVLQAANIAAFSVNGTAQWMRFHTNPMLFLVEILDLDSTKKGRKGLYRLGSLAPSFKL